MAESLKTEKGNFRAKKSCCDPFVQGEILSLRHCTTFPSLESPTMKMHLAISSVLDSLGGVQSRPRLL